MDSRRSHSYNLSNNHKSTPLPLPLPLVPTPTPTDTDTSNLSTAQTFNFYLLIVALSAIVFCGTIFYLLRRRKRQLLGNSTNGQTALARDVAGLRGRFGGAGIGGSGASIQRVGVEEALDERGEAPPPYVAGGKPPAFGEAGGGDLGVRDAGGVYQEQRACLDADVTAEAGYHEHEVWSQVGIGDMRRPGQVLTPSNT